jgi:molybdopterin converting factor small subunit
MRVTVCFYSWFKDLSGCPRLEEILPTGSTVDVLLGRMIARFPKLAGLQRSMLIAVGLDYQGRDCVLKDGDEVSLFPPVQGG